MAASLMTALSRAALTLPDVEQGIACEGTPLESRTFKVGTKAFLFLNAANARFKLDDSIPEAKKAEGLEVGAGGWTKLKLTGPTPPLRVLQRWVAESHQLMAPAAKKPRR